MIILNTNLNISIKTSISNTQIKKTFLEIYEEKLKGRYNPPTILPIPDGAPINVPIVIMQSLSNHTQLVLSKSSISIGTSYDEAFNSSWEKCEGHLLEKVEDVLLFIDALEGVKINFIGLVAQIIKDEYDDASKYIFDNLLKFTSTQRVYDTECKLTYVLKNKYYINLDIQNVRLFNGKPVINNTEYVPIISEDNSQNKVVVSIDINNRYSFNFKKSDQTNDRDDITEIVSYTRQIINNLDDIVKGDVNIED